MYRYLWVVIILFTSVVSAKQIEVSEANDRASAGKTFVVVLHADWCGPCKVLIAQLQKTDIPFAVMDPTTDNNAKPYKKSSTLPEVYISQRKMVDGKLTYNHTVLHITSTKTSGITVKRVRAAMAAVSAAVKNNANLNEDEFNAN